MSVSFHKFDVPSEDGGISFTTEHTLDDHDRLVRKVIYYGSPQNKFFSCSHDNTIRVWCSHTFVCQKIISDHKDDVNDIIKLNQEIFVSCSDDSTIRCFSVSTFEQLKIFDFGDTRRYTMLTRLTDDLFLARKNDNPVLILLFSFSGPSTKALKQFYVGFLRFGYPSQNPIVASLKFPCFYISTNDEGEPIRSVNYESERIVKEIRDPSVDQPTRTLCLFHNIRNEEILFACSNPRCIRLYNTSHPQFDTNIKIDQLSRLGCRRKFAFPSDELECCFCVNNGQYLVWGNERGHIGVYEFSENMKSIERASKHSLHNRRVFDVTKFPSKNSNTEFRIITASSDHSIKIVRVGGVMLRDSLETEDLLERIHYIFHDDTLDQVFFDEKKKFIVRIQVDSQFLLSVSRAFLHF